jgi:hypothetical protein
MSRMPFGDVAMLVQLGAGQEVCQRVVDAGPVTSLYVEVVSEGESVELS